MSDGSKQVQLGFGVGGRERGRGDRRATAGGVKRNSRARAREQETERREGPNTLDDLQLFVASSESLRNECWAIYIRKTMGK
jgi:hypothetical protein